MWQKFHDDVKNDPAFYNDDINYIVPGEEGTQNIKFQ